MPALQVEAYPTTLPPLKPYGNVLVTWVGQRRKWWRDFFLGCILHSKCTGIHFTGIISTNSFFKKGAICLGKKEPRGRGNVRTRVRVKERRPSPGHSPKGRGCWGRSTPKGHAVGSMGRHWGCIFTWHLIYFPSGLSGNWIWTLAGRV